MAKELTPLHFPILHGDKVNIGMSNFMIV